MFNSKDDSNNFFTLNFPVATPPKTSSPGPEVLGLGETGQLLSGALRLGNAIRLGCRVASRNHPARGIEEARAPRGDGPRGLRSGNLLLDSEASWRARIPEQGLGGAAGGREGGGHGEPSGQGGGGGSVTTKLGRGNYNPAIAPAYRATSDPSKRVAWEFRRRQRPVGEARGAATTSSAPPFP